MRDSRKRIFGEGKDNWLSICVDFCVDVLTSRIKSDDISIYICTDMYLHPYVSVVQIVETRKMQFSCSIVKHRVPSRYSNICTLYIRIDTTTRLDTKQCLFCSTMKHLRRLFLDVVLICSLLPVEQLERL